MDDKFKKLKVSRSLLYFLSQKGELEEDMLDDAFHESGIYPTQQETTRFLDRFILGTGAIFFVCGIVFFLAYNWADLHKFMKLGLVIGLLTASGIYTFLQDEKSYTRKIGLVVLCGLTGALFAVFGQIYQTGANAYDFFFGWTIMITAWVVISRFPALWLFYVVLINVTVILYAGQVHRAWGTVLVYEILFAVNTLVWLAWELATKRLKHFYQNRFFPRIVGAAALTYSTLAVLNVIFHNGYFYQLPEWHKPMAWITWLIASVLVFIIYRNTIKDLFFLAGIVLSAMVLFCSIFIEIDFGAELTFFFLGICVVGVTFLTVTLLIKLNKKWKQENLLSENS
ncbi:MAG: DUF2157 domain-containing protein [Flammeovirgaceae bacterium]